jgi:hypothetical protein
LLVQLLCLYIERASHMPDIHSTDHLPFPGRWLGGVCLILGPVLILSGALLRIQFHFFAPQQLRAYEAHPHLVTAAYSTYSLGILALCLGALALVHRIAACNRTWAFWGGALAVIGLFNRTFSAGVDHMAFQMVAVLGADQAFTSSAIPIESSKFFASQMGAVMLGWAVLAIGAYRAGVLGSVRSAALALMFMLPMGTLKGTDIRSIAIGGLCEALVPPGLRTRRDGPPLSRRAKAWVIALMLWNVAWIMLARILRVLMN